jgi:hypothetical protein
MLATKNVDIPTATVVLRTAMLRIAYIACLYEAYSDLPDLNSCCK